MLANRGINQVTSEEDSKVLKLLLWPTRAVITCSTPASVAVAASGAIVFAGLLGLHSLNGLRGMHSEGLQGLLLIVLLIIRGCCGPRGCYHTWAR